MIPLTATLRDPLNASVHELARCWTIERTDGYVLRFTDHNSPLILADGNTYSPAGGLSASAQQRLAGLQDRNQELRGVVSDKITEEDLRAGRYRGAKVTEQVVDWRYPFKGAISLLVFWVSETTRTGETWTAQIDGLVARLKQPVGRVYSRTTCYKRLGSTECGVTLASFTATGTVSSVATARLVFLSGALTGVTPSGDGYFNGGELTFTSGANSGLKVEVKFYLDGTKRFELQLPMPLNIAPGDTFSVVAGCAKDASDCKTKFSNLAKFGGYPTIPGDDKANQTPNAN
ncbi:MAG: DUF2163 domain-containing protein [Phycisphaeraceae bacterium]|nr:DUF2163 domain-containing protein [Phycisphaeraceae bacterium]